MTTNSDLLTLSSTYSRLGGIDSVRSRSERHCELALAPCWRHKLAASNKFTGRFAAHVSLRQYHRVGRRWNGDHGPLQVAPGNMRRNGQYAGLPGRLLLLRYGISTRMWICRLSCRVVLLNARGIDMWRRARSSWRPRRHKPVVSTS
ncbi:hypothetical protein MRB53_041380 [Persea americana]|nr:hypothetical protein MRB53_041380 [Persea americana]